MSTDKKEAILKKLKALRAKARDEASSEAEAVAAAERMALLMERHDIDESQLVEEGRTLLADMETIFINRGTLHPTIYFLWGSIAELSQTRILYQPRTGEMQVFGLEADRAYAIYLLELILGAVDRSWKTYWTSYRGSGLPREKYRRAFRIGFARELYFAFQSLVAARKAHQAKATAGTALVVSKEAAIDEFIETLDQGKPKKARKRRVENLAADAFHAGAAAGSEVTINRPIEEEACQNS